MILNWSGLKDVHVHADCTLPCTCSCSIHVIINVYMKACWSCLFAWCCTRSWWSRCPCYDKENMKDRKQKDYNDRTLSKMSDMVTPCSKTRKWPTPWHWQFRVLLLRTFRQSRHVILSKFNFSQSLLLAIIVSLLWFQVPYKEENIYDRYSYVSDHTFWASVFLFFFKRSNNRHTKQKKNVP